MLPLPMAPLAMAPLAMAPLPMVQLTLPGFKGPLDLLLQLIERRDLDISELSLVQVADQFLRHVDALKASSRRGDADDPVAEQLSEFLAIGGRLMLLKSRRMLPVADDAPAPPDAPAVDLVAMLEERRRYHDAIEMFGKIDRSGLRAFEASAPAPVDREPPPGLPDSVTLELLSKLVQEALARADDRAQRHPEVALARDTVTVQDKITELRARLRDGGRVSFREWIAEAQTRIDVIVTFIAILELYKSRAIEIRQDDAYGDIEIVAKPPAATTASAGAGSSSGPPAGASASATG